MTFDCFIGQGNDLRIKHSKTKLFFSIFHTQFTPSRRFEYEYTKCCERDAYVTYGFISLN
jgi:hypothetical protein